MYNRIYQVIEMYLPWPSASSATEDSRQLRYWFWACWAVPCWWEMESSLRPTQCWEPWSLADQCGGIYCWLKTWQTWPIRWKWWWQFGWNGVPPMISRNFHKFPFVGNDDRFWKLPEIEWNILKYHPLISTTSWHHFNSWSSKRVRRCFVDPSGSCDCWPNFLKITVSEGMPELAADVSSSSKGPTVVETCWNNGSLHGQKRTKNSPSNLKSLNRGPQNE